MALERLKHKNIIEKNWAPWKWGPFIDCLLNKSLYAEDIYTYIEN